MKLRHLSIANCSRVSDIDIDVRDNLVLIGPNGSGKTSVLLCLDMLLGMSSQRLYATLTEEFIRDESRPLSIEALFGDLDDEELAAFPDEVDAQNGFELSVRLDVRMDGDDIEVERSFPRCGLQKGPSKIQKEAFGWTLLQAQASSRDVRQGRRSIVDEAISGIDLGTDKEDVAKVVERMAAMLSGSKSLEVAREELAGQFSQALPFALSKEDLEFIPGAAVDDDLMSDVRLRIREEGRMRLVHEHSDGTRALLAMAIYDLMHKGANILAIDEPEAHLHPSSQRSLAKMLKAGTGQRILVTHSPTIAGSFEPDEIVVIRSDGTAVQPAKGFLEGDTGMLARWWIGRQLEPLTAGTVIAVEGPSDRIIVNRVASVLQFDLDRHDVVIVETEGCGDMKVIESIFGNGGFDIPLFALVDEDARISTAKHFGADPASTSDMKAHGVFVSSNDLEDEYVRAVGASALWRKMKAAELFSNNVFAQCVTGADGEPTEEDLADFIRAKKKGRKIPAALIASELIDETNVHGLESIVGLLKAVSS